MKTTYRLILTAIAATAALVSCTKEPNSGQVDANPASGTLRTITVSFGSPTKSSLSGLQPSFVAGDEIMLTNGQATETCTVFMEDNAAKIKTSLTGEMLLATYPASCGIPNSEGVRIPTVQTGKFADANIACAIIAADAESADFQHLVAILKFYVDKSIGVKSIKITSSDASIANYDGSNPGYYNTITVSTPEGCDDLYDAMPNDGQDKRVCYVAVDRRTSDLSANSLTFECETSTQGTVTKTPAGEVQIEKGSIYNVFMPYYINVKVSNEPEEYQKWGYCNVGAFLPEEPGYYFSWGNTQGYLPVINDEYGENVDWILPSGQPGPAGGFTVENYSNTNGAKLTGNIPAENDAATAAWGGKWRMPAVSEFEVLCALKPSWTSYREGTQKGISYGDLFIPAVGRGYCENLMYPNKKGSYWSSTLSSQENPSFLYFESSQIFTDFVGRYQGTPIRPIYGDPVVNPTLPGVFSVGEKKTVKFTKGNLYFDGTTPKFEANQYDYRNYCGKDDDQAVINGVLTTTASKTVGSFFWCSTAAAACAETYDDETPAIKFFAEELSVYGTMYSSLTKAEWEYLLGTSEKRNGLHKKDVTIKLDGGETVMGLVIAPDGFDTSNFKDSYTKNEWAEAESTHSLVFLPAAGSTDDTDVWSTGEYGYYWLSDYNLEDTEWVYYLDFGSSYAEVHSDNRATGYSVRLVKKNPQAKK